MNDLQGHSRSPQLLPFDRPYTISYWSSIVSVSLSCTVYKILTLIWQKIKTSHDQRLILLGPTRAQNMTILSSAIPEKFKGL